MTISPNVWPVSHHEFPMRFALNHRHTNIDVHGDVCHGSYHGLVLALYRDASRGATQNRSTAPAIPGPQTATVLLCKE